MNTLQGLIKNFSTKNFPVSRYQTQIESQLAAASPTLRNAAVQCLGAINLWESSAIESFIAKLKPVQIRPIKEEIDKYRDLNGEPKILKLNKTNSFRQPMVSGKKPIKSEESKEEPKAAPVVTKEVVKPEKVIEKPKEPEQAVVV